MADVIYDPYDLSCVSEELNVNEHNIKLLHRGIPTATITRVHWIMKDTKLMLEPAHTTKLGHLHHYIEISPLHSAIQNENYFRRLLDLQEDMQIPNFPHKSMKILYWNCFSAGYEQFKATFDFLQLQHNTNVVVLFETKVNIESMGSFFNDRKLTACTIVAPTTTSSGTWILWDPTMIAVKVVEAQPHRINAFITRVSYKNWIKSKIDRDRIIEANLDDSTEIEDILGVVEPVQSVGSCNMKD